ncbi:hypothetical protein M5D96_013609, partial [Drosophila gunungcola]
DIQQLEVLCKQLYEATDISVRAEAEEALVTFVNSQDAYAQLLAASTLTKLIQGLSLEQRIDIRSYALNYLATRPNLQHFVVQALVTLLAKITKFGWFDAYKGEMVFQNILEDVKKFLQGSVEHCTIGVQILSQLVCEMNSIVELDVHLSFSKNRKIATSYRDQQLYDTFLLSCSLLITARENSKTINFMDESQQALISHVLRLTKNCLSFDFIGSSTDESADDMNNVQGLGNPDNYHEFCRLLARLKSNYQLGELIAVPCYPEAIELIAKFTVQSLHLWLFAPNSVHYLLTLWQRMVASVPYVKSPDPHFLGTYTPEVIKAYIDSRLDAVPLIVRDNLEDPLDDLCMVQQQLEQLSVIERRPTPNANPIDITIHELQLTWLVYIIGSAIVGRLSVTSDEHDTMDAELVIRVLQLMSLTDARLPQAGCEKLELAILSFLDQFWGRSEPIITKTLMLLSDLSVHFNSVRKLARLEEVQFMLTHHTSEHFPFLGTNSTLSEMRCRTMFYTSLGRFYYADYLPILLRAMELWAHDPAVTTPVLKLFAELVHCRTQRLAGNVSSPMGILLFREASKLICIYGNRILHLDVPREQLYPMRLKGIAICFLILKNSLGGNYVNCGVFKLYGDNTLDNVLNIIAKLILSIQQSDLLEYPKLSSAYYSLLNCLSQDHVSYLAALEPAAFVYILKSLTKGLAALDSAIYISCCTILDSIVSYIFKQLQMKVSTFPNKKLRSLNQENAQFLKVVEINSELLQSMMSSLLNNVLAEDGRNQWSMSRPLLVLILLYEDYYRSLKDRIICAQPIEKQQTMAQWFDELMVGIERNVSSKNKEKFTQNLSTFRRDVVSLPKSTGNLTVQGYSRFVQSDI